PWWGRAGFVGVPTWHGWGGPHVVNNVVINRTTVVNVNNITYQNVNVRNAVVAAPVDRFGRGTVERVHVRQVDPHQLQAIHGPLPVKPVSTSLTPTVERGRRPPDTVLRRPVVATRAPRDVSPVLQQHGINAPKSPLASPRIVPAPKRGASLTTRPAFGQHGTTERAQPAAPPRFGARPAQPEPGPRGQAAPERAQ